MKRLIFMAICCLTISLTSCREEKKKETKEEAEVNVSVETDKGSIKADDKGNVDVKIEDN